MMSSRVEHFARALVLIAAIVPLSGESINPPTTPQTAPMNKQEKKNLDFVIEWRIVTLDSLHVEQASKYLAENYIQHNPNANTGLAGFVQFVGSRGKPKNPIPDKLENPPVVMGARGDYVWLIFEGEQKDPRDPSKTYHFDRFEVLRLQNGKIQEHWDNNMKMAGSGNVNSGVSPKPPSEWNTGKLDKQEKETLALATEEMKDMLQYGHLELGDKDIDAGYIQHNPNVPQGLDGFKLFMSRIPGRRPEDAKPIKAEWLNAPVLTLTDGSYCLMMWERMGKDPDDPSKTYNWYHFDVIRAENGKVKEHWDEAKINPPQARVDKQ